MLKIATLVAALTAFVPAAHAGQQVPAALPAAGPLIVPTTVARAQPNPHAKAVAVLHQFRPDFRDYYVLAVATQKGSDGKMWVKLQLQLRPNGTFGWIPASAAQLTPTRTRIVVHRGLRTIDIYSGTAHVAHAGVAIGSPGRETPLGRYYVTARFVPDDSFLGVFAVETSAYSKMTEWPGGGLVGIHGTSAPQLIGQAVSHGCVRVTNATALLLKRWALLGTPISIVAN
jgi:lipoprotein-anchoring transpeptidase ErfK/SrfK